MKKSKINANKPVSKYFLLGAGFEIKEGDLRRINHRNTFSVSRIKN